MKKLTIIALLLCFKLSAQTKTDYGFADKSIPELAQFEYYCGEWKSEIEMRLFCFLTFVK